MSDVQSALSMPGRVIVLCGPPGSGKGVVAGRAAVRGLTVLSLGDVVRAETADRGLPETTENVGQTALSMREEQGETIVVDRLMPSLSEAMESSDVLIDGMRQTEELERLREHIGDVTIVALTASAQAREGWWPNEAAVRTAEKRSSPCVRSVSGTGASSILWRRPTL